MMDAPESASTASAVMPTVAPLLAFSAIEFAFASLSERVGSLSSTLVILIVKLSVTVPPSEDVAWMVMVCEVSVS